VLLSGLDHFSTVLVIEKSTLLEISLSFAAAFHQHTCGFRVRSSPIQPAVEVHRIKLRVCPQVGSVSEIAELFMIGSVGKVMGVIHCVCALLERVKSAPNISVVFRIVGCQKPSTAGNSELYVRW
jgi:hypothetical protein